MFALPEDVVSVRAALEKFPDEALFEIGSKLIIETAEIAAMWKSLERRKYSGDPKGSWVWRFLSLADNASKLPVFHYRSSLERKEISESIRTLSSQLAKLLEYNELDAHFIHADGAVFNGFYIYEDFGESNRARIDDREYNKLKASTAIRAIGERASKKIADEPALGKVGANAKAIRFVRIVAKQNLERFGEPLNAVVAAAANAVFSTSYRESDIRNLLSR